MLLCHDSVPVLSTRRAQSRLHERLQRFPAGGLAREDKSDTRTNCALKASAAASSAASAAARSVAVLSHRQPPQPSVHAEDGVYSRLSQRNPTDAKAINSTAIRQQLAVETECPSTVTLSSIT